MYKHLLFFLIVLVLASCKNNEPEIKIVNGTQPTKVVENPYKDYAKVEFGIKGMTCAMGCAKTIEKKIAKMDGVHFVYVDFEKELAMVEFNDKKIANEDFISTVTSVSDTYKVEEINSVTVFTKDKQKEHFSKSTLESCCKAKKEDTTKTCSEDCVAACCNKSKKV